MKYAICLLAIIIGCQAITDEEALEQYQDYQKEFSKSYRSLVEHRHRFSLFKQKLEEIEAHNKLYAEGKVSWYKGLTPFSDWTREEFSSYVNKYKFMEFQGDTLIHNSSKLTAPESIDWREKGAVTEVKNQGACGSCWTFSTTGTLEGAVQIKHNRLLSLSEQNLVDCVPQENYGFGCRGGVVSGALQFVKDNGITLEDEYPYTGVQGPCQPFRKIVYAADYVRVPQTENDLLNAVGTVGPVSIAIVAAEGLGDYKGGVLDDASCGDKVVNHAVLAVGYGSENGLDYWLIKNSWGDKWGDSGYYKMVRGKNSCGITTQNVYPLV